MPEKKRTEPEEERPFEDALDAPVSAPAAVAPRYKVLSSGLSGADGAHYAGEVLTAEQIGNQARIDKLLARKSIEAI